MISIIIPCYNYARFLPSAIDSALEQSSPGTPFEVIVVDDGSTDDTAAVVARYGDRVRYHHQKNAGLSAARNTGMQIASHDWVVFLDSDDALVPDCLRLFWQALQGLVPKPAVLAGLQLPITEAGKPMMDAPVEDGGVTMFSARHFVLRNRFAPGVLAQRAVLLELGGFDPSLRASEDRDMWIRVAARHQVGLLHRLLLLKREHGSNMSRHAIQQTAAIEQVLTKAFAHPDLQLTEADRRLAWAGCFYQSALMYADAGDHWIAAGQMLRSMAHYPLGAGLKDAAIPEWSRLRGLAGMVRRGLTAWKL